MKRPPVRRRRFPEINPRQGAFGFDRENKNIAPKGKFKKKERTKAKTKIGTRPVNSPGKRPRKEQEKRRPEKQAGARSRTPKKKEEARLGPAARPEAQRLPHPPQKSQAAKTRPEAAHCRRTEPRIRGGERSGTMRPAGRGERPPGKTSGPNPRPGDLGLKFSPAAFLLGLLAASFQIFLLREFAAQFFGNELVFGLVLAAWLFWGGCGSLWASGRDAGRKRSSAFFFGVLLLAPACFAGLRFTRSILGLLPGEWIGLGPILVFAVVLSFFLNFPLGAIFVFTVKAEGPLPRVYLWESIGAASGGLLTYFVLIPLLSNWGGLAFIGAASAAAVFFLSDRRKTALVFSLALAAWIAFFVSDIPSQALAWRPFTLVRTKDSLYGKLQVIRTSEQITLYDNSMRVYSFPDPASAEESVHFALLQRPEAGRVLLVGGGVGGSLTEILKYPRTEVDYVELDPEIIRLSELFRSDTEKESFRNPRVHLVYDDGRAFLERSSAIYDVVILNLPEPSSAQINRFYTREFFVRAREKLAGGGVFSFRVPSAENYIRPELQEFLSVMARTLRQAFPEVKVVPGDSNIFLASAATLTVDSEDLIRTLRRLGLNNRYVTPERLPARLHPLRVEALRTKIESGPGGVNSDLHPDQLFLQFRALEHADEKPGSEGPPFPGADPCALAVERSALRVHRLPHGHRLERKEIRDFGRSPRSHGPDHHGRRDHDSHLVPISLRIPLSTGRSHPDHIHGRTGPGSARRRKTRADPLSANHTASIRPRPSRLGPAARSRLPPSPDRPPRLSFPFRISGRRFFHRLQLRFFSARKLKPGSATAGISWDRARPPFACRPSSSRWSVCPSFFYISFWANACGWLFLVLGRKMLLSSAGPPG